MNTKTNRTRPRWYHMSGWQWPPTGGYCRGMFEGFAIGIMLLSLAQMKGIASPKSDGPLELACVIIIATSLICRAIDKRRSRLKDELRGRSDNQP
jgi:hypothetical protein